MRSVHKISLRLNIDRDSWFYGNGASHNLHEHSLQDEPGLSFFDLYFVITIKMLV